MGEMGNEKQNLFRNPRGRGHLKEVDVEWTITLMRILTKECVDWIKLAQERTQ
jgi:hypothetical protein